ncbi:cardiolipin synthase [Hydrogenophaga sp.]|uniref:cardiolipin synthase n=1 Tax=Hydrogenophaga sp. TaxID=1904254 RepID=UPI0025C6F48E|nr:cardiolipin synthase [Hydrogenophaga sp.]
MKAFEWRHLAHAVKKHWIASTLAVAHVLGLFSSIDALMDTRTAPGAVAWIISLNTFPVVSVPAYWVFGRAKFNGYVIGRRDTDSQLHHALAKKMALVESFSVKDFSSHLDMTAMERLAKLPTLEGNDVELLTDGEATFRSIFEGIQNANHYLLVQFYIVRDDIVGRDLSKLLQERARAGVAVHFLYDEIGSYQLPQSYLNELRFAGVQVRPFHSTRGSGNRFQMNFRNHRKIVIADGGVGWVGGLNVGDEYLGRDPRIGAWRDTHLRLAGPAVFGLQLSFLEDWYWATGEALEYDWKPAEANGRNLPVLVLPSGPADRFETASLMVQLALSNARSRVWIASPYFVPDEGVQAAMKLAALRGVDVRILIPEKPDNPLLYFAAYAFLGPLLEAGVNVYRYHGGFLHCKTILVDDKAAAVGTVNLDNRSFRLNFEITTWVYDRGFAEEMAAKYQHDFSSAHLMTASDVHDRPWWFRLASRAAYLLAPVL